MFGCGHQLAEQGALVLGRHRPFAKRLPFPDRDKTQHGQADGLLGPCQGPANPDEPDYLGPVRFALFGSFFKRQ